MAVKDSVFGKGGGVGSTLGNVTSVLCQTYMKVVFCLADIGGVATRSGTGDIVNKVGLVGQRDGIF